MYAPVKELSPSLVLCDGQPAVVAFALPEDAVELAAIERSVWSEEHAAPLETIRSRLASNPQGTLALRDAGSGRIWGFYSLVPVDDEDSRNVKKWDYYADLSVSKRYLRTPRRVNYWHSVSLTVSHEAPRGAGTELVRAAAQYSRELAFHGATIVIRAPRYHLHQREMGFADYYAGLMEGRYPEPLVKLCRNAGGVPGGFVPDYFKDPESADYGVVFRYDTQAT